MTTGEAYNLYRSLKRRFEVKFCFNSCEEFMQCIGQPPSRDHRLVRWPNTQGNFEAGNLRWLLPNVPAREQLKRPALPAVKPLTPAFW